MNDFDKELKAAFLDEAEELCLAAEGDFLRLEKAPGDPEALEGLYRVAHNLKGSSRAVGFPQFGELTHAMETVFSRLLKGELTMRGELASLCLACNDRLLQMVRALRVDETMAFDNAPLVSALHNCHGQPPEGARPSPQGEGHTPSREPVPGETLRVALEKIDGLLNNVGELVVLKTMLANEKERFASPLSRRAFAQLEKTIRTVQDIAMGLRMVPVEPTFSKMRRIVRDVSERLGKVVELELRGLDTEIDKKVLEGIADPLMHLVHNAVDHGIAQSGRIVLSASHHGEHVVIECRDDGRGLDPEVILAKAVERGLVDPRAKLTEREIYQLLFLPGFSTRSEVTEISGRGVGLDVVKHAVAQLGGQLEIESRRGEGTKFKMLLPFTLAIIDAMVVQAAGSRYVFPMAAIHETLQPREEEVRAIGGSAEVLRLRGEVLPLYYLSELLGYGRPARRAWESIVLVVKSSSSPVFSVVVDDILGQQQVVTKRLGAEIEGLPGLTGSAILGDGKPALVMDPVEVIEFRRGYGKEGWAAA